jgi:hypothetical protein
MNETIQEYWVTETGEWGSNDVETVTFEGHHENIHEAFELVHDWELPEWANYLSRKPHEATPTDISQCTTCEDIAEQFGTM